MKVNFKNLKNKHIKIESGVKLFGLTGFLKVIDEFGIMPNECISNCSKLAAQLNINGHNFEFVECLIRFKGKDGLNEDEYFLKPHCISYWNGHYIDFTLEMIEVLNIMQDDMWYILPDEEIIPIRRYEWSELRKAFIYANEHGGDMSCTFIDKYWNVDDAGKIHEPASEDCLFWFNHIIDYANTLVISEKCWNTSQNNKKYSKCHKE